MRVEKARIEKIHPYKFKNNDHFQFFAEFLALLQNYEAVRQKVAALFADWLLLYQKEDAVFKKIVKSAITEQIQEADKARDDAYNGMREINTALLKHFDPQMREAARRLKIVFDTYGDVAKKRYDQQTADVTNIVQDLEGRYLADTTTVGLLPWAIELKARNIAFMNLMRDRYEETADNIDISLKEIRAEADAAFFAIRDQINALVLVEGGAIYDEFIKNFNVIIAKFALLYKPKRGKRGSEEEAEELEDTQVQGGSDEN